MAWLRNRRNQLLLLVGVLAAGALGFFLLTKGSSAPPAPITAPSIAPGGTGPAPSPSPSGEAGRHVPVLVVFTGRDPFQATSAFQPFASPSPTSSPSSSSSQSTGSLSFSVRPHASTTVGGHSLKLMRVYSVSGVRKADFRVGATVYRVPVGESFDHTFKLSSVAGSCANLLYGDQAFSLCT